MLKDSKRGISGHGFAGGIAIAVAIFAFTVIIFYPKTLEAAGIIFTLVGIGDEEGSVTITEPETIAESEAESKVLIKKAVDAFEFCKSVKGNDCLCNSNLNLDLPLGRNLVISKSAQDVKVSYDDKTQTIKNVEFCVVSSVVRPNDLYYTFSNAIDRDFVNKVDFIRDRDTGKLISYSSADRKTSFEVSPLKLFKHVEGDKIYLCLARSGIGHKTCS